MTADLEKRIAILEFAIHTVCSWPPGYSLDMAQRMLSAAVRDGKPTDPVKRASDLLESERRKNARLSTELQRFVPAGMKST